MFGRQSPPGSLLVTQREADRNTRFNTTASAEFTYLLTPTPDGGWKALNTGQTVSLDQRAIEQDRKLQVPRSMYSGFDLFMMAFAVVAFIGLAVLGWLMSVANRQGTVAKKISCPGCKVVNYPAPSLCGNCGGGKTRLRKAEDRKGYRTIVTYCESCFARTTFDPYCIKCETDLTLPLARKFALPTLRGAIHALLFDAPAPRPDKTALLIFAILAFAASALAQTPTLTPGQTAAIKAEEARHNAELGEFPYGSITFTLDSINDPPPKKTPVTGTPKPGTVAVRVIEHLSGGKQPPENQGYQPVTYWLAPLGGNTWKAEPAFPSDIYPTFDSARNTFHQKEVQAANRKAFVHDLPKMLTLIGGLVAFPVFLVTLGLIGAIPRLKRQEVPREVVCPGCNTVVRPQAGVCANCRSANTRLIKVRSRKSYAVISTYCKKCHARTTFDPYCPVDEVDLTPILLEKSGTFRFASLFERR
jgi:hypothetical protein